MVTVTTPVGFDAKATVMKMGSLQAITGSHENMAINKTCVLLHTIVDTARLGAGTSGQGHLGRNRAAWMRA